MTVSDQVNGEWVHNCDPYASTEAVRHINIMASGSQWFGLDISATGAASGQGSFVAMPGMQQEPTSAASTEPVSTVAAAPTSTTNLLIPSSTGSTSVAVPADGPLVAASNEAEPTNINGNHPGKDATAGTIAGAAIGDAAGIALLATALWYTRFR